MQRSPQFFFARAMHKEMTFEEKLFWNKIRDQDRGYGRWRRQVPILKYIIAFCCHEHKLIVELDGSQHDINKAQFRTDHLAQFGFQAMRAEDYGLLLGMSG